MAKYLYLTRGDSDETWAESQVTAESLDIQDGMLVFWGIRDLPYLVIVEAVAPGFWGKVQVIPEGGD